MKQDDTKGTAKLAYTVAEAKYAIGLSRSKIYQMISAGTLRSKLVGGRRLIPADALAELVGCAA